MPDLASRTKRERELTAAALLIFRRYADRSPQRFPFDAFHSDLHAAIQPVLADTHQAAGGQLNEQAELGLPDESLSGTARHWSGQYGNALAGEIVAKTRDRFDKAADRRRKTIAEGKSHEEIEAIDDTGGSFDESRAANIGVTETTRAITAGEGMAILLYRRMSGRGVSPNGWDLDDGIWETAGDDDVCEDCDPLDDTGPDVWREEFPEGPPAHGNCRCFLRYSIGDAVAESSAAKPSAPLSGHVAHVMEGGPGSGQRGHHTDHPDHARAKAAAMAHVERGLTHFATDISPELAQQYRKTASDLMNKMPPAALDRFTANVSTTAYYGTAEQLTGMNPSCRDPQGGLTLGCFDPNTRVLHMDGGHETGEPTDRMVAEIHAHEIAHAIDRSRDNRGTEITISRSRAWRAAHRSEIMKTPDPAIFHKPDIPREAFADLYAYGVTHGWDKTQEKYPQSCAALHATGVI
jgi:hypothetical protein